MIAVKQRQSALIQHCLVYNNSAKSYALIQNVSSIQDEGLCAVGASWAITAFSADIAVVMAVLLACDL